MARTGDYTYKTTEGLGNEVGNTLNLWHFDNSLADSGRSGDTLTSSGGSPTYVDGKFGKGIFHPSSVTISTGTGLSNQLVASTQSFTIEGWIGVDQWDSDVSRTQFYTSLTTNERSFNMGVVDAFPDGSTAAIQLQAINTSGVGLAIAETDFFTIPFNVHWAMTWDYTTSTVEFFVNGVRIYSSVMSPIIRNIEKVGMGGWLTDTDGWIDEVRISDAIVYSGTTYDIPTEPFSLTNLSVKSFEDTFVTYKEVGLEGGQMQITGSDSYGQLGNGGTNTSVSSPVLQSSDTDWREAAMSLPFRSVQRSSTFAIKTNGTLWSWGSNLDGRLALGVDPTTEASVSTPVQVGTETDWKKVICPTGSNLALKNTGELYWAGNYGTPLGLSGVTTDVSTFLQIGSNTDWVDFWVSMNSTDNQICIVTRKADDTIWAWGYSNYYIVGQGSTALNISSPIQIGSATDWQKFAPGFNHSILLKTDGTLWSTGIATYGQTGQGDITTISTFVQIGSDSDWADVASGQSFSHAIKTDGTLWAWGYDAYGNLGQGTFSTHLSSPTQVGALTTWKNVFSGQDHTIGIMTDGTMYGWGSSIGGMTGTGLNSNVNSPVSVSTALTDWRFITCGCSNTIWIQYL